MNGVGGGGSLFLLEAASLVCCKVAVRGRSVDPRATRAFRSGAQETLG